MEAQWVPYPKKWRLPSPANPPLHGDEDKTVQSWTELHQYKKKQNRNYLKVKPKKTAENHHRTREEKENTHRGWASSITRIKTQTKMPLKRGV